MIPWIAQGAGSGRVAHIDSHGARLLAAENRRDSVQPLAGVKLTVVAAIEGFDWVFQQRLEHGLAGVFAGARHE